MVQPVFDSVINWRDRPDSVDCRQPRAFGDQMETIKIKIEASDAVTGLLMNPAQAHACFVFAHGAGAGMRHSFMEAVATGLFDRGIGTLRYQFPYIEKGSKRPDAP